MNPRQRLPRYAEGRRPCIKTVSAQHSAQSSKGSQPTDCTFIRSLEGGVAATTASSEPVGVCCPPRLQEAEHCSLPEESLSSLALEKCRHCERVGCERSGAVLQEPACAREHGDHLEPVVLHWWSSRSNKTKHTRLLSIMSTDLIHHLRWMSHRTSYCI